MSEGKTDLGSGNELSGREVLDIFIGHRNAMAANIGADDIRHEELRTRHPELISKPYFIRREGRIAGRREELVGMTALIERVRAEIHGDAIGDASMRQQPESQADTPES